VTFDIYKVLKPAATEAQLVGVGRIVTVVMVGLSMLWVPFIKYLSSEVYIYLQSVQAYISPPIAAVFLVGVFWPRANRSGAIAALVVGAVLGAARFLFELNRGAAFVSDSPLLMALVNINFLHFAILLFVVSLAILVVVSLATAPESMAKLRGLSFATLEESYRPAAGVARSVFTMQAVATIALALFTIGLWVHFA
jgi:SSS family solute:Na+ symporter